MKTIADLNTKWWYRLLKIVYCLCFAGWLVVPVLGAYIGYKPDIDTSLSYIECASGKRIDLKQNDFILSGPYLRFAEENKARLLCLTNETLGYMGKQAYPDGVSSSGKRYADFADTELGIAIRENHSSFLNKLEVKSVNYDLNVVYKPRDWLGTIGYFLLAIFTTILVFEVLRRLFYYVILGNLKPLMN